MILNSITNLVRLQLKFISLAITPPISLTSEVPPFFSFSSIKSNINTKLKLYAVFLFFNALWQIKISPRNTPLTTLISIAFFSFGLLLATHITVESVFLHNEDVVTQLNLILTYEYKLVKKRYLISQEMRSYQNILKWIVTLLGTATPIIALIGITLINIMDLKRPPFIGSILPAFPSHTSECLAITIATGFVHLVALFAQAWIISMLGATVTLMTFHVFVASVTSLWVHLKEISRWDIFMNFPQYQVFFSKPVMG